MEIIFACCRRSGVERDHVHNRRRAQENCLRKIDDEKFF
jgi:hypothetical protein